MSWPLQEGAGLTLPCRVPSALVNPPLLAAALVQSGLTGMVSLPTADFTESPLHEENKNPSIFSHPSTLKSMPVLRAAVFRVLQSEMSPCLSQGLGSVTPQRSRGPKHSLSEAGLG